MAISNRKKRRLDDETVELNITAFLNLMVILVPFLLITAVFSRLTILQLNLPPMNATASAAAEAEPIKLQLQLAIRANSFDVQDPNLGIIKRFARSETNTDWSAFNELLLEIKRRFPDEDKITLLLEPDIDYQTLIQVMDRVRYAEVAVGLTVETYELFPNITIGDAPILISKETTDTMETKE